MAGIQFNMQYLTFVRNGKPTLSPDCKNQMLIYFLPPSFCSKQETKMLRDQQRAVKSDLMLTLISFTKLCVKVSAFNILLVTVAFIYSLMSAQKCTRLILINRLQGCIPLKSLQISGCGLNIIFHSLHLKWSIKSFKSFKKFLSLFSYRGSLSHCQHAAWALSAPEHLRLNPPPFLSASDGKHREHKVTAWHGSIVILQLTVLFTAVEVVNQYKQQEEEGSWLH